MVVATVPVTDIEKAKDFYAGSGTSPGTGGPFGAVLVTASGSSYVL
jgi:hypothetical protein